MLKNAGGETNLTDNMTRQTAQSNHSESMANEVSDFFHAAAYGITQPITGSSQWLGGNLTIFDKPGNESFGTSAGLVAGTVADFGILNHFVTSPIADSLPISQFARGTLAAGLSGAAYEFLSPVANPDQNFFGQKWRNTLTGGLTFAALRASSDALTGRLGIGSMARAAEGGISGLTAGTVNVLSTDVLNGEKPTRSQAYTALSYGLLNGAIAGVGGSAEIRNARTGNTIMPEAENSPLNIDFKSIRNKTGAELTPKSIEAIERLVKAGHNPDDLIVFHDGWVEVEPKQDLEDAVRNWHPPEKKP